MLASCSLQEIRQEDLAAILPDQQDCDAFGGFEYEQNKTVPDVDASGSDMELPTQLVNAAIQRVTESSSETESPPATYASTLLQQFVQQQQLLTNPPSSASNNDATEQSNTANLADTNDHKNEIVKRKRGRPRKNATKDTTEDKTQNCNNNILNAEYCGEANVSPDSGIQNSPDHPSSPEPTSPQVKEIKKPEQKKTDSKSTKKIIHKNKTEMKRETKPVQKHKVSLPCHLDRVLFVNTDRVLYPPRRKPGRPTVKVGVRKPGRPPKNNPPTEVETENVAPVKNKNVQEKTRINQSEVKKVQNTVKKDDGKKTKKSNRTLCDSDIVQITSNTYSLSLGKTVKKDEKTKTKTGGAILNEICERVSKRLELNNTSQLKPLEENKSKSNTKKVINNIKTVKNLSTIKNKTKLNAIKSKYATLKHLKVMHTKKHKKHKKHKIKILKTISVPHTVAKVDADIDKLIIDFMKLCNLGTSKSQKENLPEVFRCVKRVSKKRKGTENTDGRKKKKQTNVNSEKQETNSNEQRLPLKKRHYHVTSEQKHSDTPDTTIKQETPKEKDEAKINPTKNGVIQNKSSVIKINEKKALPKETEKIEVKTPEQNKNESKVYDIKDLPPDSEDIVASHIDEAIEACINKYTHPVKTETQPQNETVKTEVKSSFNSVTATTPKKRHRLEAETKTELIEKVAKKLESLNEKEKPITEPKNNLELVVNEIKNKKNLNLNQIDKKSDKNIESIAQMITRKKNRLEDLASNLVSKINPTAAEALDSLLDNNQRKFEKKTEKTNITLNRASVIKSPIAKKIKPVSNEILDSVVNEKPTGIFMQTVDIELQIPSSTIQTVKDKTPEKTCETHNLRKKKTQEETEKEPEKEIKKKPKIKDIQTDKTEKTKPILNEDKSNVVKKKVRRRKAINRTGFPTLKKKKKKIIPKIENEEIHKENDNAYDRVPRLGEEASTFMKRTQSGMLSVVSLEKLQAKPDIPPIETSESDIVSKWEVFSECDSLPMDECTFTDLESTKSLKTERSFSRLDVKDRMTLRVRDVSPATSVETKSSETKKSRLDIEIKHRDSSTGSIRTSSDISEIDKKTKRKRDKSFDKSDKKQKREEYHMTFRKRLREVSPTSSIEQIPTDKKQRNDDTSSDDSKRNKKIPRWRKKYLIAGLFSDYYKEDDEQARVKRENANKTKLVYKPEEHPYGLLPPPYHCGKYLRCRKVPFQLPHDLWWQHTHAQLPGRDLVPSWNYKKIRTNVYFMRAPTGTCEPQACNCKSGCEDDCINRLVLSECPASHRCQNQKIQRHEWSPGLEKFMTDSKVCF